MFAPLGRYKHEAPERQETKRMNGKTLQTMILALSLVATPALAKSKARKPKAAAAAPAPATPSVPPRDELKHVPPDRGHSQPEAKPSQAPQKFVEGLYERVNTLAKGAATLAALHGKIGDELKTIVDYPEMARLALGQKWAEIDEGQKKEFLGYLTGMVLNTYVKRFKPGQAINIKYAAAPKQLPEERVQVASTITVGQTSAEVHYALRPMAGHWMIYDIVVDEASQVQTYRQSFKKILDKEGWPGLMSRMKKAAEKKA